MYAKCGQLFAGITLGIAAAFALLACNPGCATHPGPGPEEPGVRERASVELPAPGAESGMTLEEALRSRSSVRTFSDAAVPREQAALLLRAAYGRAGDGPDALAGATRTAPSAGGLDPLELLMLEGNTLYRYFPDDNRMELSRGDVDRNDLAAASYGQGFVGQAPLVFIIAAEFEKTRGRYGERGDRYVFMEAGHAGQNILLQAAALGLGAVPVGAFEDDRVSGILGLPRELKPLYIIPVGTAR